MRIIDSHNHVYYHKLDPAGVVGELDAFGIERCWVLTWYLPPGEDVPASHGTFNPRNFREDGTHAGSTLDDDVEACRAFPERFVGGYCPCPAEGSAAERLQAAHEFYGVRVCGEWSYRMLLDDPRALQLFCKAGELGMPVVLHLDVPFLPDGAGGRRYMTNWYGGGAAPLERALRECPETVFVGHAPGFWRFLSGDEPTEREIYPSGPVTPGGEVIRLLESYPNLWADLSAGSGLGAMRRDEAHARRFLTTYQDRLLFGRDAPGDDLRQWLLGLDLDEALQRKLFHENAERLLSH
jgi:predicted TIM-barrel fold metal-dependent hydrolase